MDATAEKIWTTFGYDIEDLLNDYYEEEIAELYSKYPNEQRTLTVEWSDILRKSVDVADYAIDEPESTQTVFEKALAEIDRGPDIDLSSAHVQFKDPEEPYTIPELKGGQVGKLVTVRGQVAKASAIKPRLTKANLRCKSCGGTFDVHQPVHGINKPNRCLITDCNGQSFEPRFSESEFVEHQLIRLKEMPEDADGDEYLDVHLRVDLPGRVKAGDRVDVTGVLKTDFDGFEKVIPDFWMDAHAIQTHETDYEDLDVNSRKEEFQAIANGEKGNPYELLIDSIAPSITGDDKIRTVKLAIALQLFGGWRRPYGDGRYVRGDSHMAVIGEAGTGKSSLLEAAEKISPRSGFVSGKNASQAGVTAAAVRDDFGDTEWSLEAGAVVKAHKGLCCIDEIDKVEDNALSSLHTALEKQRLEFNKAGIDASLRCETSILAAGNPTNGEFIDDVGVIEQLNMEPPLRSRFDLIFTLRDDEVYEKDKQISDHQLKMRQLSGLVERGDVEPEEADLISPEIPIETLRAYIAYARENVHPVIESDELNDELADWFATERSNANRSINRRMLEGVARLAEASARVRLSETVTENDIERAKSILKCFLEDLEIWYPKNQDGQTDVTHLETGVDQGDREMARTIPGLIETLGDGERVEIDEVVRVATESERINKPERKIRKQIRDMIDSGQATTDMTDDEVRML